MTCNFSGMKLSEKTGPYTVLPWLIKMLKLLRLFDVQYLIILAFKHIFRSVFAWLLLWEVELIPISSGCISYTMCVMQILKLLQCTSSNVSALTAYSSCLVLTLLLQNTISFLLLPIINEQLWLTIGTSSKKKVLKNQPGGCMRKKEWMKLNVICSRKTGSK